MARPIFIPSWRGMWAFLRDVKTDWKPKVLVLVAVAYLLWPIDALPDVVPLVGWLDDLGLGTLAIWYLGRKTSAYLGEKR